MSLLKKIFLAGCLAGAVESSRGAQVYTETYPLDFAGWNTTNSIELGVWSWAVGGQLELYFDAGPPDFAVPQINSLLTATNTSSDGRFTGNWATSGVEFVGFDLVASNFPPTGLDLRLWDSNGGTFSRALPVPPVGALESFYVSAESLAAGGWLGTPTNSEAAFSALMTNVTLLRLTHFYALLTNGPAIFRFDNFSLTRALQWDGGTNGQGTNWLTSTNWFPDGIPGANARVVIGGTGSTAVINIDSSQATGGVVQVGQFFCTVSNRVFETASSATNSKLQLNGYGGIFMSAGSNTVTFRNGPTRTLELVTARYRGAFDVAAGGAIIVSNCVVSETNVSVRVDKTGAGLLFLGASNKFSGGTRLLGGTLRIGHTNALSSGVLMAEGGLLDLNGFNISLPRLTGGTGVISDARSGVATTTVTIAQTAHTTFTGMFSNGTERIVAITKNGTGTLFIAGTNLNSGPTLINTGRLMLAANGVDAGNVWRVGELGPGTVTVATGAVFGGYGRSLGLVDNAGLVLPGTGVLVCVGGYLQRTNAVITFMLGGTNAALNQTQFTDQVFTNTGLGFTNIVTNTVVQTALYSRMQVDAAATFAGTLRVQFVNGFVPSTNQVFDLIAAPLYSGTFSTNSLLTNNLPALPGGLEWNILYTEAGVSLACVPAGSPVKAYIAGSIATEGNTGTTNLLVTFALSKPATATVTIAWTTATNGTATAGTDYTPTNGLVTINTGSFIGQTPVLINGDTSYEFNETIRLQITALTNALPGSTNGTAWILNDDPLPTITIGTLTTNEDASFDLRVTLSNPMDLPATFTYATAAGTALAGSDYTPTSGTFLITGGTTNTLLHIPVTGDSLYESNETLTVTFANPINATLNTAQVLVTILNDDPLPAIAIGSVIQSEGDTGTRNFIFQITLANATIHPVTFSAATTTGGSATAGADYIPTTNSYTINPGTLTAALTVIVISDTFTEPNETIQVMLFNPTNATIPSPYNGATILDDDYNPYPGFLGFVQTIPDGQQHHYLDDPDADGQPNLYEYVFLSNPNDPAALGLFHPEICAGTPGLRFNRNFDATDIILEIITTDRLRETTTTILVGDEPPIPVTTTNPVTWTILATLSNGLWTGLSPVTETGTTNPLTARIPDPSPAALTNRHYRVRVWAPDP